MIPRAACLATLLLACIAHAPVRAEVQQFDVLAPSRASGPPVSRRVRLARSP